MLEFLGISKDIYEHALALHEKSVVVDNAKEFVQVWSEAQVTKMNQMFDSGYSFGEVNEALEKMRLTELTTADSSTRAKFVEQIRKSGVTCTSVSQNGGAVGASDVGFEESVKKISRMGLQFDKLREILLRATCVDDILNAKKERKLAVMLDFQNSMPIGMNLDNVDLFYGLGIRQIQLSYNLRTLAVDGCTERTDAGLSYWGVRLVERMNELGMIVDTGHTGLQSTLDAAEISKDPITISHTCCKSIHNHDRCKTDEVIKAVAEKGGVIGIAAVPFFLAPMQEEKGKKLAGTLKNLLDHVDYAVKVAGIDHVGIGSDTADIPGCPERWGQERYKNRQRTFWHGWREGVHMADYGISSEAGTHPSPEKLLAWSNWPNKTVGLVSRGYSDQEVQKIVGGNWLRFYRQVIG